MICIQENSDVVSKMPTGVFIDELLSSKKMPAFVPKLGYFAYDDAIIGT